MADDIALLEARAASMAQLVASLRELEAKATADLVAVEAELVAARATSPEIAIPRASGSDAMISLGEIARRARLSPNWVRNRARARAVAEGVAWHRRGRQVFYPRKWAESTFGL